MEDDVSVTADPGQILIDPLAVIFGTAGVLAAVTLVGLDVALQPLNVVLTV